MSKEIPWNKLLFVASQTIHQTTDSLTRSSSGKPVNNPATESDLQIRFERHGPKSRAEVSGRINIDSSPEFRGSLLRMLRAPDC
jgi:hypothetical protein